MPNSKRKNWLLGVAATVTAAIILIFLNFGLRFQSGHYVKTGENTSQAGQNTRSIEQSEKIQGQLVEIVGKLTDKHEADDAALEERARLCRMEVLKDVALCGEVGVEIDE